MRAQPIDFVQLTYNSSTARSEHRILPLARERGIAVIVNRPFREGDLIRRIVAQAAAALAGRDRRDELGAAHPEVHRLASGGDLRDPGDHARRSRAARTWARAHGPLPDAAMRARIIAHVEKL